MELIHVTREEIEDKIIDLKVKKEIVVEQREDTECLYLYPFYKAEKNVAEKILQLQNCKNVKKIKNIETELKKQEKEFKIQLSDEQKEAIHLVNDDNVCIITGGPGTGKTTIIKNIIELYQQKGMKVVLCAPTGRAAKRMTEQTGVEAKTIHRLLEIGKLQEESQLETVDYDVCPVDADVIIIDEMSMVDIFIMNYVMKGIFLGTKVVFVGDSNQLPSVGPGSVLKDLIESEKIKTIQLNKIFRQAAQSDIIVTAHNVNNGKSFTVREENQRKDFFYIKETNPERILNQVITLSNGRLKAYGDYDFFKNIQILTPTKKGMLGTKELNKRLQEVLNPQNISKNEKKYGDTIFREDDRVMQVKNNYDIYWEKQGETGSGVFNGELGYIEKIDEESKQVKVEFDDEKEAWYTYAELEQLEHAYSITIHKSQRQ